LAGVSNTPNGSADAPGRDTVSVTGTDSGALNAAGNVMVTVLDSNVLAPITSLGFWIATANVPAAAPAPPVILSQGSVVVAVHALDAPLNVITTGCAGVCDVSADPAPALTALKRSDVGLALAGPSTVSVAELEVAEPALFVKTARYSLPESPRAAVNEYVVDVAPLISLQVEPLFVLTCHFTVGDGEPLAEAENDAVAPAATL
jgi:hypothetical protein